MNKFFQLGAVITLSLATVTSAFANPTKVLAAIEKAPALVEQMIKVDVEAAKLAGSILGAEFKGSAGQMQKLTTELAKAAKGAATSKDVYRLASELNYQVSKLNLEDAATVKKFVENAQKTKSLEGAFQGIKQQDEGLSIGGNSFASKKAQLIAALETAEDKAKKNAKTYDERAWSNAKEFLNKGDALAGHIIGPMFESCMKEFGAMASGAVANGLYKAANADSNAQASSMAFEGAIDYLLKNDPELKKKAAAQARTEATDRACNGLGHPQHCRVMNIFAPCRAASAYTDLK